MKKLLFDLSVLNNEKIKELDATTKLFYIMLAKIQIENGGGTVIASNSQLSSLTGFGTTTVSKCKTQLRDIVAFWNVHEMEDGKMSKVKITAYNINKDTNQNKITNEKYIRFKPTQPVPKVKSGYVYFIKNNNNQTKIGLTTNVSKRFSGHTDTPELFDILHVLKSKDMRKAERLFHEYFKDKRITGEWFDLNNNDIDFIKSNHYPTEISEILI